MPISVLAKFVWRALGALSLNVGTVRTFTMHQDYSIILLCMYKCVIGDQMVMMVVSDASDLWFKFYKVCLLLFLVG